MGSNEFDNVGGREVVCGHWLNQEATRSRVEKEILGLHHRLEKYDDWAEERQKEMTRKNENDHHGVAALTSILCYIYIF